MIGRSMTEGAPWKHILRFAMPVLAGSLLQQLYNTADSIIVGQFSGQSALSAVGTTNSFVFLFLAIAMGFSAGNGIIVAQHYGAGDEKQVRRDASTGIIMLMIMGAVSAVVGFIAAYPAFKYLVAVPDELLDLTLQYFQIYAFGLIFQFGYNIFSSILRAVGDSAATLYFLLISSVLNIGLDLLFVAVFDWGVAGAAAATDIAQAASFVAAYIYMVKKYPIFRFKLKEYVWDKKSAVKTLTVGSPIALQLVIVSFGFTFIQRAVNEFGENMTASFTVGSRIEMYLNLPCNAFQTTLATYAGQNIGAGKTERAKKGVHAGQLSAVIVALAVGSLLYLLCEYIMKAFGADGQVLMMGISGIRFLAFCYAFVGLDQVTGGAMRGAGAAIVPAITAITSNLVRIPLAYFLGARPLRREIAQILSEKGPDLTEKAAELFAGGAYSTMEEAEQSAAAILAAPNHFMYMFYAMGISMFIGALLIFLYFKFGNWHNKSVVKREVTEDNN